MNAAARTRPNPADIRSVQLRKLWRNVILTKIDTGWDESDPALAAAHEGAIAAHEGAMSSAVAPSRSVKRPALVDLRFYEGGGPPRSLKAAA